MMQLERLTKQMREAEQRLKAIPQFCFPDAKDWSPVSEYTRYPPHIFIIFTALNVITKAPIKITSVCKNCDNK